MTRRMVVLAVVGVGVLAGAGIIGWTRTGRAAPTPVASSAISSAAVVRTDLSTTTQISATLGFAGSYAFRAPGAGGTITALPAPGQVVTNGQVLYELDGQPTYLLFGSRPPWRTFSDGMPPGPDVDQLEQDLIALGFATPANLTVDQSFTSATAAAVRRWQRATGQTVTGSITLGRIVFAPESVRVTALPAGLGASTDGGLVVQASSTTPDVMIPVPAAQAHLVHVGDHVSVTLPSGSTTTAVIDTVSSVAQAAPTGPNGNGPTLTVVPATATLTDPAAAGAFDQAPVTVNVVDEQAKGVLAVPVTALVALAGGGFGVWVRTGASHTLVAVTPGLFANALVAVSSSHLQAGDRVEVPSP
ncbi:MAG: peptidoglycan-binding protein [Actinobacteria bacterium]|nr:peptidoglycan-binding protein [Actinomycetota bacterium]